MSKRVRATDEFKKLNKRIHELNRVPEPNEEFILTDDRYYYLSGMNPYKRVFVKLVADLPHTNVAASKPSVISQISKTTPSVQKTDKIPVQKEPTPVKLDEENPDIIILEPNKEPVTMKYTDYVKQLSEQSSESTQPKKRGRKKKQENKD